MDHTFIILLIYAISMLSALFGLWIRWEQDENAKRLADLEKQHEELQKQLKALGAEIKSNAGPFKK